MKLPDPSDGYADEGASEFGGEAGSLEDQGRFVTAQMTPSQPQPQVQNVGWFSSPEPQPPARETSIPKTTFATPRTDHVSYLRTNRDEKTASYFDEVYGPGAAARIFASPAPVTSEQRLTAETTAPRLTPKELIAGSDPGVTEIPKGVNEHLERLQDKETLRDSRATTQSLKRVQDQGNPEAAKAWIDQEVQNGTQLLKKLEARVVAMDRSDPRYDKLVELRDTVLARVTTAEEVRDDALAEQREMEPRVRVALSMVIAGSQSKVKAAEETLKRFQSDPDFRQEMSGRGAFRRPDGTVAGDDYVKSVLEQNVRDERKRLNAFVVAQQQGVQRGKMKDATTTGEVVRGLVRGLGISVEMFGGDLDYWANGDPLLEQAAKSLRGSGQSLQRDTSAKQIASMYDISSVTEGNMWAWTTIAEGLGTTAPILSAVTLGTALSGSPLGGAASAIGAGTAMGRGEMMNSLRDAFAAEGLDFDRKKANHYVGIIGNTMGAADSLAALFFIGQGSWSVAARRGVSTRIATVIAQSVKRGALAEGLTEGFQSILKELGTADAVKRNVDWQKYAPALLEEIVSGSLSGGFMSLGAAKAGASKEVQAEAMKRFQAELKKVQAELEAKFQLSEKLVVDPASAPTPPLPPSRTGGFAVPDLTPQPEQSARQPATDGARTQVIAKARSPIPEPVKPERERAPIKPKDIIEHIRERGGIIDDGGDLRAMDAPAGVISDQGMTADDMRQSLVDAGFLIESDPNAEAVTTVDDVYELVRRGLAGETVVPIGREADAEAYDAWRNRGSLADAESNRIISDLQADLDQYGIELDLNRVEEQRIVDMVRNEGMSLDEAFERNAIMRGGGVRAGRPSNTTAEAPFPSMEPRVGGRQERVVAVETVLPQLRSYLKNGGSLSRKAYRQIARQTGVPQSQIRELLEAAEASGIVKRDRRGVFRRDQVDDPNVVSIDQLEQEAESKPARVAPDADAGSMAATGQSSLVLQKLINSNLMSGKTVAIGDRTRNAVKSATSEALRLLPDDAGALVLSRIVPRPLVRKSRLVDLEFEDMRTGETVVFSQPVSLDNESNTYPPLFRLRAFHAGGVAFSNGSSSVAFVSLFETGESNRTLAGQAYHEIFHLLRSRGLIDPVVYDRLVSHALRLRVMDMQLGTVMQAIGDPSASYAQEDEILVSEYRRLYAGRKNINDKIDEEGGAHFLELAYHGHWMDAELEPVREIVDDFFSGRLSGAMERADEGLIAAIRDYDRVPVTPGLDMSQEARLQRAREMGFDTDTVWYHSSNSEAFDAFDLGRAGSQTDAGHLGRGIYFADNKGEASYYAPHVKPYYIRGELWDSGGNGTWLQMFRKWAPKMQEAGLLGAREDTLKSIDRIDQLISDTAEVTILQDRGVDVGYYARMPDPTNPTFDIGTMAGRFPPKTQEEALEALTNRAIHVLEGHEDFPGLDMIDTYTDFVRTSGNQREIAERLSEMGYSGIREGSEVVVFDPSNIRSVNAAFDPARSDSANLMFAMRDYDRVPVTPVLSMDKASRMARAKAMGFDTTTVYYHGTDRDFNAFATSNDEGGPVKAVFVSSSSEFANKYAKADHADVTGRSPRVLPLLVRGEMADIRNPEHFDRMLNALVESARMAAIDQNSVSVRVRKFLDRVGFAKLTDNERAEYSNLEDMASRSPDELRESLRRELTENGAWFEGGLAAEAAQLARFDGVILSEGSGVSSLAIFNPSNIRSVNAAFDPARADSANLMFAMRSRVMVGEDPLTATDSIERIAAGEIAVPSSDQLLAAANAVKDGELRILADAFGGDMEKARRWQRLWNDAELVGNDAAAKRADVERAALTAEATPGRLDEDIVLADRDRLLDLHRAFRDIEQHPDEVAEILPRYLSDLPSADNPKGYLTDREYAAMAVLRKAGDEIRKAGLDSEVVTKDIIARYSAQFSNPSDAAFMVDQLRALLGKRNGNLLAAPRAPNVMFAITSLADRNGAVAITDIIPRNDAAHPDKPILAFHGTPVPFDRLDPGKSKDIGVHFGSPDQANDILQVASVDAPSRLIPVVVDVKNPATMNDLGSWQPEAILKSLKRNQRLKLTEEQEQAWAQTFDDTAQQYELLRSFIEDAGFDSIRYLNTFEGVESDNIDMETGRPSGTNWSYIVWSKDVVRSATDPDHVMFALRAYHGSPYNFKRFSTAKIGEGEGFQAFGHGLYFTETEGIARHYVETLGSIKIDGREPDMRNPREYAAYMIARMEGDYAKARAVIKNDLRRYRDYPWLKHMVPDAEARANAIDDRKSLPEATYGGKLYEVSIEVEKEELLNWDIPLKDQSEDVKRGLRALGADVTSTMRGGEWHDGVMLYDQSAEDVAKKLREVGIRGVQYLDGNSRADGTGSQNFVVFDEADIRITAKDGEPVTQQERQAMFALRSGDGRDLGIPKARPDAPTPPLPFIGPLSRMDASPPSEALKRRALRDGFEVFPGYGHIYWPGVLKNPSASEVQKLLKKKSQYTPNRQDDMTLFRFIVDEDKNVYVVDAGGMNTHYTMTATSPVIRGFITRKGDWLWSTEWGDVDTAEWRPIISDVSGGRETMMDFDTAMRDRASALRSGMDPAIGKGTSMFAIRSGRDVDALGFYSAALEAAKGLKQAKGTPEQMLSQLKKAGVKEAEIEATKLREFLDGKKSVTQAEIVQHLTENRVRLNEVVGGHVRTQEDADLLAQLGVETEDGFASARSNEGLGLRDVKFSSYSLDPDNPTYRETVLHMDPEKSPAYIRINQEIKALEKMRLGDEVAPGVTVDDKLGQLYWQLGEIKNNSFNSGHFPEPNITGHLQTSIVKHAGRNTFLVDQIQSDWGQRLRDGGVRDEAKIAELKMQRDAAKADSMSVMPMLEERGWSTSDGSPIRWAEKNGHADIVEKINTTSATEMRIGAELQTAEATTHGNPLVNTTDQWTTTTLRKAIEMAVASGAEYIAIPHGDTVLSYNPGDTNGMRGFYGSRESEGIVPKNLRKLLEKMDKAAAKPMLVDQLETPMAGMKGSGFTLFPITDQVRASVREGQAMFALRRTPSSTVTPIEQKPGRTLVQLVEDLTTALEIPLGTSQPIRAGRLNPGLKAMAAKMGMKLQGQYDNRTGVVRVRSKTDIETIAHEGGHALENRFRNARYSDFRNVMELHRHELEPLASPGRDQLSEGFAEFFRGYVTNPSAAENKAPDFFEEFEDYIDQNEPALREALQDVQEGYQELITAPSGSFVMTAIQSAERKGMFREALKAVKKRGVVLPVTDWLNRMYTANISDANPWRMATRELLRIADINLDVPLQPGQKIGVGAASDPYKLLEMARLGYQAGHMDLMRGVLPYRQLKFAGPSFQDAVSTALGGKDAESWSDDNIQAFGTYLAARRMVQEYGRFQAGEIDRAPDKFSLGDWQQAANDLEAAFPNFKNGASLLYDYQNRLLQKMHDAGFLTDEQFVDFAGRDDYVPLQRVMDDSQSSGSGDSVGKSKLIKRFRGSDRDIINPLESITNFTYEVNFMIRRNEAVKAMDSLARAVGPGGGAIAERIPANEMTGSVVDIMAVLKSAGKDQGIDAADMVFMMDAVENTLNETTAVTFKAGELNEKGEAIVYLWEGGKRVPIRLADGRDGKEMLEAITAVVPMQAMDPFIKALSYPTQWLRAGITTNPSFLLANFQRDQVSAWALTEDFTPYIDGVRGTVDAVRSSMGAEISDLDLYNAFGGIMGGEGLAALEEGKIRKDVQALRRKGIPLATNTFNPMGRDFWIWTGWTETGTRLQMFRNAKKRAMADGLSEYESAIEAIYTANDYINFSRNGSKTLVVKRLMTFLNAALQGLDRTRRGLSGQTDNVRTLHDVISPYIKQQAGQPLTVQEKKRLSVAAKTWMKIALYGFVTFSIFMMYEDDEEFQEISPFHRSNSHLIKINGEWLRIPRAFELGALGLAMEYAYEAQMKGNKTAYKEMREGVMGLFVPPNTVPGVQVAYEIITNQKVPIGSGPIGAFFNSMFGGKAGAPIVPQELERLPPEMQFTAYTSEFSKWAAQQTGMSAAKIEHLITGVGGSNARDALGLSNTIMPALGLANERPTKWQETVGVRRFTLNPMQASRSKQEFWGLMGQTNSKFGQAAEGYKEYQDRGQSAEGRQFIERLSPNERAYAVLEAHGTASQKRMHPMSRAKDILSVLNGVRRQLQTGELKDENGEPYSLSQRKLFREVLEQWQTREARNALVTIGHEGFDQLRMMQTDKLIEEARSTMPDLMGEVELRMRKKKVQDFEDVRQNWPSLKAELLDGSFAETNPVTRKSGRMSQ